ncbi:MAG: hypothetical protein ABIG28_00095 [archaeon]
MNSPAIYTDVMNGAEYLEVTIDCFWSETQVRCGGDIVDIKTESHTSHDIYVDLIFSI